MKTIVEMQVENDHLERLSQVRKPILAVAELIWNAVDADADKVEVNLINDALGELVAIEVIDDGHGMPHAEAVPLFSRLGGSWKRGGKRSREKNRLLHGQEGRGRLRAFGLGRVVDWHVTYLAEDGMRQFSLSMIRDTLKRVEIDDEEHAPKGSRRGVIVKISELHRDFRSVRGEGAAQELSQIFALYLRQYPTIAIWYDGQRIDPNAAIENSKSYALPAIVGNEETFEASIEIVEWRMTAERRLFFCDEFGFPLDNTSPGIQAPGFSFTVYLKSSYFAKLLAENRLEIANLDAPTAAVMAAAKECLREHFRHRASEKAAGLVARWQEEDIYPYQGAPITETERVERQVFNVVALNVNHYLPAFDGADEKTKRFQLRLLRNAVENAPADLSKIINEVLDLPQERRAELAGLLDRTTLSHIISASKIITDRLEFLLGLEILVFDAELKHQVQERAQLHRILAENAWIFGEQYHLSVDDQSLTEVLKHHISAQSREIEIDEPVKRPDGKRGIVDLMFSRNIQLAGSEEREHLIVELKRPDVVINQATLTQIKGYAFAVAEDQRFREVPAKWVFWAVSSEIDTFTRKEVNQRDRPRGMLHQSDDPSITIWVKTWSQIISDCRARLRFFSEKLNYSPDRDSSLEHLRSTYDKYLADLFAPSEVGPIQDEPITESPK
ncbi:histidine kinase/DNA gyrase B/HSP90-like ATPase [Rhizobium sp. PP-CC-2G-626]|nr:histidine kinase/DNA gyrase B/HSP90-like ATPase [Rhizobium sp. PP-CC-2G-626]